jgi:hypothetical protein
MTLAILTGFHGFLQPLQAGQHANQWVLELLWSALIG